MSYGFYKVMHIMGILGIFMSFGALILNHHLDGEKKFNGRKAVMITHGVAMTLTLVAGFGLLARIGLVSSWPTWVWFKLGIWLILGVGVALPPRIPQKAPILGLGLLAIGGLAAYMANFKPF